MNQHAVNAVLPLTASTAADTGSILQRKYSCGQHTEGGVCATCKGTKLRLQRSHTATNVPIISPPPIVNDVLHSPGRPLDTTARTLMESRFGHDFSKVRIHTDTKAHNSARAIQARAYTVGREVVFGSGEYSPHTSQGKLLLAHELTHVLQQGAQLPKNNLVIGSPNDSHEHEADRIAKSVVCEPAVPVGTETSATNYQYVSIDLGSSAESQHNPTQSPQKLQMVPAAPTGSTYRFCGFGITTHIPGFIQSHFTGSYDVDYTTGCNWIWGNAWSSLWELYDSQDTLLDSDRESPFGGYTIRGSDVGRGSPGDGQARWSLWYQITHSQPWLRDDPDAYPHHWVEFDVYQNPIRNPNTTLREETGPVVWQDNFTPAEDGASLSYNFSATASRTTTDSQTTNVSATIGGQQSSNIGFEYEGLTGGFSRALSYSSTVSLSRMHSVSVATSQTLSRQFTQPNLRGGVTYSISMRPLYHLVDGTVDTIPHRNGVITGTGQSITGAIRVLKGMDLQITSNAPEGGQPQARPWRCTASCNVEGTEPQCTGRVNGEGTGPNQNAACRAAKKDANNNVPRGCYKRHCQCDCSQG